MFTKSNWAEDWDGLDGLQGASVVWCIKLRCIVWYVSLACINPLVSAVFQWMNDLCAVFHNYMFYH